MLAAMPVSPAPGCIAYSIVVGGWLRLGGTLAAAAACLTSQAADYTSIEGRPARSDA